MKSLLPFLLLIFIFAAPLAGIAGQEDDSWLFNRQGMLKAGKGDHAGAIRDFETACRLNPFNDAALSNLACAHNNLGVILAGQKNYDEAIRHFTAAKAQKPEDISIRLNLLSTLVTLRDSGAIEREATEIIRLRPTDVETVLKVAAAFQNSENHEAARITLEQLADSVPENPRVHETLGRLLYHIGELNEAEFHLSRATALSIAPAEKLQRFLNQVKKENQVQQNSASFTSIHFSLTCDESFSEQWAEELLEHLEEAYEAVGSHLNFYPSQRSQVIVLQTEDFRNVHDLPEWAGGVYDGKIRLPVPASSVRPSFLRSAIRHEYTHHVVYLLAGGNCPIWLNEGLAQIFEFDSKIEDADSQFAPDPKALENFAEAVRHAENRTEVARIYQNAHLTTMKIINETGWPAISSILENLSRGFSFAEAGRMITGFDLL